MGAYFGKGSFTGVFDFEMRGPFLRLVIDDLMISPLFKAPLLTKLACAGYIEWVK